MSSLEKLRRKRVKHTVKHIVLKVAEELEAGSIVKFLPKNVKVKNFFTMNRIDLDEKFDALINQFTQYCADYGESKMRGTVINEAFVDNLKKVQHRVYYFK